MRFRPPRRREPGSHEVNPHHRAAAFLLSTLDRLLGNIGGHTHEHAVSLHEYVRQRDDAWWERLALASLQGLPPPAVREHLLERIRLRWASNRRDVAELPMDQLFTFTPAPRPAPAPCVLPRGCEVCGAHTCRSSACGAEIGRIASARQAAARLAEHEAAMSALTGPGIGCPDQHPLEVLG